MAKKKKAKNAKKAKDDEDDDFELDFSGVKNWLVKKKKYTYPLSIILLISIVCFFAWNVRTQSAANLQGKFLLGLDPYFFLRYAKDIVSNEYTETDIMRFYPTGFQRNLELPSPSFGTAIYYKALNFLGFNLSVTETGILFPAISTIFAMIFFFLFVKEVFKSNKIAFVSSMLLSVVPGFLFRTSAGFLDKESIAMVFFFGLMFFMQRAFNQKIILKKAFYGLLSGIFLMGSALSWGGANILLIPMGISFVFLIFFKISKRSDSIIYLILTLFSFSVSLITPRYGVGIDVLEHYMFLLIPISLFLNIYCHEIYPKISKYLIKYKPQNLPEHFYMLAVAIIIIFIVSPIFPGIDFYQRIFAFIQEQLNPVGDAFSRSVSENQPPYFISLQSNDWWSALNFIFFTMIIGSFFLFYEMLKKFPKQRLVFSIIYALIIMAFIFSRFSDSQEYATFNSFFEMRILGIELHYIILSLFLIYSAYFIYKNRERMDDFSEIKFEYLFLFILFFLSIVVSRGSIRLIFMVCPSAAILSGYAFEKLSVQASKIIKSSNISYFLIGAIFLLIFFHNYNISFNSNKNFYSSFTTEWDEAMQWVRENTANDSVFTHWWDYGYWVQTMGERATTLDGGNYYVQRNHLTGRYLFASRIYQNGAYNMTEPATHLIHDFAEPDYFLIIDDDVLKFVQMGRIGKRPVHYSVGGFSEEIENPGIDNATLFPKLLFFDSIYGAFPVQEDFVYNNFIFKKESTFVLAIIYPFNPEEYAFGNPYAYIYNQYIPDQRIVIPFNGQCFFGEGCFTHRSDGVREYPLLLQDGVVLITENASDNLFTYLYLLNMSVPGFEIAYDNERALTVQGMASQSLTDIKIYKINYDELGKWALDEGLPEYWSYPGDAIW
ncbi:MAG: STT3 domain-containing protein [Candidatus Nanoarchaeia archaeon]|nr:STT3 domain-containing protein [Candidatus Nanoarchaeia archaeon]